MKMLGPFYRRFYGYTDCESLKQLYLIMIRPRLGYACQVWDPHLIKDEAKLEKVQKFACRMALSRWNAGYQELQEIIELSSRGVEAESTVQDPPRTLLFPRDRVLHNSQELLPQQKLSLPCMQLTVPFAQTNSYKYSFSPIPYSIGTPWTQIVYLLVHTRLSCIVNPI